MASPPLPLPQGRRKKVSFKTEFEPNTKIHKFPKLFFLSDHVRPSAVVRGGFFAVSTKALPTTTNFYWPQFSNLPPFLVCTPFPAPQEGEKEKERKKEKRKFLLLQSAFVAAAIATAAHTFVNEERRKKVNSTQLNQRHAPPPTYTHSGGQIPRKRMIWHFCSLSPPPLFFRFRCGFKGLLGVTRVHCRIRITL